METALGWGRSLRHSKIHWDCVSVPFAELCEEVEELGCGGGSGVDHRAGLETSHYGSGQKHQGEELVLAVTRLAVCPAWPCSA